VVRGSRQTYMDAPCSFIIFLTASMRCSSFSSLRSSTPCTALVDAGYCVVHIIASISAFCAGDPMAAGGCVAVVGCITAAVRVLG
jgi:hypothetical protein